MESTIWSDCHIEILVCFIIEIPCLSTPLFHRSPQLSDCCMKTCTTTSKYLVVWIYPHKHQTRKTWGLFLLKWSKHRTIWSLKLPLNTILQRNWFTLWKVIGDSERWVDLKSQKFKNKVWGCKPKKLPDRVWLFSGRTHNETPTKWSY